MIRFSCPSCGNALSAPEEAAGRAARCRGCGTPMTVPKAPEEAVSRKPAARTSRAARPAGRPPRRESEAAPKRLGALPYVLAGGALLLMVAGAAAAYGAYHYLNSVNSGSRQAARAPAPPTELSPTPPREANRPGEAPVVTEPAEEPERPVAQEPEAPPEPALPPEPAPQPPREPEPAAKPQPAPKPEDAPKPEPLADDYNTRSAETRAKLLKDEGGNEASEAAVMRGLEWLAQHQAADGHWSLDAYQHDAHDKRDLNGKRFICTCGGPGLRNDTAGTAFGLLPFLGAGITPRDRGGREVNYGPNVEAALRYLTAHQDAKTGDFGGGMYAHGLATIAVCEAYGMTADARLKVAAQEAIDFIVAAQDPTGGGWRYTPRQGGDTSVLGWQMMALKSGQMAGLKVPKTTLERASKWLDSCEAGTVAGGDFGYGYVDHKKATPTMTAVGLLCRECFFWSPRKPELIAGVKGLKEHTPGTPGEIKSMYFNYYATQVIHHAGGESWNDWNPKMRDSLIKVQDKGKTAKKAHQGGSWGPEGDAFGAQGGRLMQTSLSLLTLEVYYRHAPLHRRAANPEGEDKK